LAFRSHHKIQHQKKNKPNEGHPFVIYCHIVFTFFYSYAKNDFNPGNSMKSACYEKPLKSKEAANPKKVADSFVLGSKASKAPKPKSLSPVKK
jgi:hypothetical protein